MVKSGNPAYFAILLLTIPDSPFPNLGLQL
jgi:hypothetical protein